jgi:DNA polymerase-3 subunit epsilon
LLQEVFNKETVAIHGLRKQENYQVSEQEAILEFLKYIGNATLVGHHINFDIEMINMALKRLEAGKLKNEGMDTNAMYKKLKYLQEDQNSSLDELAKIYKIRSHDRHTAVGDSYITALLFLKLKKKLKI